MTEAQILALKDAALQFLSERLPDCYTYHCPAHTERVLRIARELGRLEALAADELELLRLAALFHDFGYIEARHGNENLVLKYIAELGQPYGIDSQYAEKIARLVAETAFPYAPSTRLGRILCDADIEYVGSDDFETAAAAFRVELARQGKHFNDREWFEFEVKFLEGITFFSDSARRLFEAGRIGNLNKMRRKAAVTKD